MTLEAELCLEVHEIYGIYVRYIIYITYCTYLHHHTITSTPPTPSPKPPTPPPSPPNSSPAPPPPLLRIPFFCVPLTLPLYRAPNSALLLGRSVAQPTHHNGSPASLPHRGNRGPHSTPQCFRPGRPCGVGRGAQECERR